MSKPGKVRNAEHRKRQASEDLGLDLALLVLYAACCKCFRYTALYFSNSGYLRLSCGRILFDDLHYLASSRMRDGALGHSKYRGPEHFTRRVFGGTVLDSIRKRIPVTDDRLCQQVTFRFEVAEERSPGGACRQRYFIDRGFVKALLLEEVNGGVPNGVADKLLLTVLERCG